MTDLVVKTNWLNQALQNLSLIEIRIIQLAIVDARESGLGLSPEKPLTIHAKRYAKAFDVQAKNAYANIKEAEDTLFKRQFTFTDNDGKAVKSRWLQQVRYLDEQGCIEMIFTVAVVQGISRIDGAVDFFTKYMLSNTVKFKSVYSVRLYELLNQWKKADVVKMPMCELQRLRGQLGVEDDEYKLMADFKKRVLDYAINEINEFSDLQVSYKQVKNGRKIIGFNFKIKVKNQDKKDTSKVKKLTLTAKQRFYFASQLARLPELSYLAKAGQNYDEFAKAIADELCDAKQVGFYRPFLEELGLIEK